MHRLLIIALLISFQWSFGKSRVDNPSIDHEVQFLITTISDTSNWGHVSLRVAGPHESKIYDFGRYGEMWAKNAEGDPVLRVWTNKDNAYMDYNLKGSAKVIAVTFKATQQQINEINNFYNQQITGPYSGSRNIVHQNAENFMAEGFSDFHVIEVNCTTVAVDAFENSFSYAINGNRSYIKGRDVKKSIKYSGFNWLVRNGMRAEFDKALPDAKKSGVLFWPADLAAFLEDVKGQWPLMESIQTFQ